MIEKTYAVAIDTLFGTVNTLPEFILKVYDWMLTISISISILLIIYAGFLIVTSGGNPEAVATAKRDLSITITGVILLFVLKIVIDLIWKPF
jgi:TRAP-type C4-dicarboxylate transport system permease small subunit